MLTEIQSRTQFDHAVSLLQSRKIDEAEAICKEVIDVDPINVYFLALFGTILILRHAPNEAIKFLKRTVDIEPDFAKAHTRYRWKPHSSHPRF